MKSRTSFFNKSLLRKDIVRFAPAWVLFAVFLLLCFSDLPFYTKASEVENYVDNSMLALVFYNMIYALICAQLLFGDLFKSRMCNGLHALPIRRDGWFLTHVIAGLLFAAIPAGAVSLMFLLQLGSFWSTAFLWMGAVMLQFVVFFAVAVLSMMLVGNRFAAVLMYLILNFLSLIILWLLNMLYLPFLEGVVLYETPFYLFSPMANLLNYSWIAASGGELITHEGWGYLAICTAVSVVLLGVALLLYRRRPLEKAGDFIVFKPVAPVFLLFYTFSVAAVIRGIFGDDMSLFLGLAIGYFTGRMLLDRTIRVFRKKAIGRFCLLAGLVAVSIGLTVLDPLGITSWVPETEKVQWVSVSGDYWWNYYYKSDAERTAISDPDVIQQAISIHQYALENQEWEEEKDYEIVQLTYRMKDGRTIVRNYTLDQESDAANRIYRLMSRPECVFGTALSTVEALLPEVDYIYLDGYYEMKITDREQLSGLLEALIADAKEGNADYHYTDVIGDPSLVYLRIVNGEKSGYQYIINETWRYVCSEESTNVMAWVKENIK